MKALTLQDFKFLIQNLFKNKTVLDKISESDDGNLLYNGESVLNDFVVSNKRTYSSDKIEARLEESQINITPGQGGSGVNILQKTYLNKLANDSLYISTTDEFTLSKCIVQVYKIVGNTENVVETLKTFDNTDAENFYYNKDGTEFSGVMKIKDTYTIGTIGESVNTEGYYESETIDKTQFVELYKIEIR